MPGNLFMFSSYTGKCNKVTHTITPIVGGYRVTWSTVTPDATCYYTLDGTTPTDLSSHGTTVDILDLGNIIVKIIVMKDGYDPSDIVTFTISIDRATLPDIERNNIADGMTLTFSRDSTLEECTLYYRINQNLNYSSTSNNSVTSSDIKTAQTQTASCYVTAKGYYESEIKELPWELETWDVPTISLSPITNGQKVSISNSTGNGRLNYKFESDDEYSLTSLTSVTSDYTHYVASQTSYAFIDNVVGYAKSSVVSNTWTVQRAATPSINKYDIVGGISFIYTTYDEGDVYYKARDNDPYGHDTLNEITQEYYTVYTSTQYARCYITNVTGYAQSLTQSLDWTLDALESPTITANPVGGGYRLTVINNEPNSILNYTFDGETWRTTSETSVNSGTTYSTSLVNKDASGTLKAYSSGISGKVVSPTPEVPWDAPRNDLEFIQGEVDPITGRQLITITVNGEIDDVQVKLSGNTWYPGYRIYLLSDETIDVKAVNVVGRINVNVTFNNSISAASIDNAARAEYDITSCNMAGIWKTSSINGNLTITNSTYSDTDLGNQIELADTAKIPWSTSTTIVDSVNSYNNSAVYTRHRLIDAYSYYRNADSIPIATDANDNLIIGVKP